MPFQSALQPLFEVILTAVRRSAAMGQWVKKKTCIYICFGHSPKRLVIASSNFLWVDLSGFACIYDLSDIPWKSLWLPYWCKFLSWCVIICLHLRPFGHSPKKLVIAFLLAFVFIFGRQDGEIHPRLEHARVVLPKKLRCTWSSEWEVKVSKISRLVHDWWIS